MMNAENRLITGIILLVIGCVMPLLIVPVTQSGLPSGVKTLLGGILFFGFEIMAIPAVAIMGKDNYLLIVQRVKGWFGRMKPSGNPGRIRYNIGLALFLLPVVPTYIMAYAPQLLPDVSPQRLWVSVIADVMFLSSLFVLGGDFWDKLRALFVREARAVFPHKNEEGAE